MAPKKKKKEHWGVKVGNMFIDRMRKRTQSGVKEGKKQDYLRTHQNRNLYK